LRTKEVTQPSKQYVIHFFSPHKQ